MSLVRVKPGRAHLSVAALPLSAAFCNAEASSDSILSSLLDSRPMMSDGMTACGQRAGSASKRPYHQR